MLIIKSYLWCWLVGRNQFLVEWILFNNIIVCRAGLSFNETMPLGDALDYASRHGIALAMLNIDCLGFRSCRPWVGFGCLGSDSDDTQNCFVDFYVVCAMSEWCVLL